MKDSIKITLNNLVFDCRIEGNPENELVLFLHGWPETSHMWIDLMANLSNKGYFCVAPNLRGFSPAACPKEVDQYSLEHLTEDVIGIFNYFDKPKFHLVGHDWGAIIGWKVVHDHPDKVVSWTSLSVPHPQAFGVALAMDPEQRKKSQYIKNFQVPELPEQQLRNDDFKALRDLWKNSSKEEIDDYLSVFSNPDQLTATLNYYRGNFGLLLAAAQGQILGNINTPTLFIWGNQDLAIGAYAVNQNHQYMKNEYEFIELDAGHWLIQTHFEALNNSITKHLTKNKQGS